MKLIQFLKPDLKKLVILLIILSPVILFTFSLPAQFYLWDNLYNQLGVIVIIPFIIVSMIFFGGFDTGGGLFQSLAYSNISTLATYLIGIVFWYVISCVIATGWNLLFKSFSKNSKTYEKAIVISFFTIFAVLVIMPSIATYSLVTEKTTRQNISMDELVFFRDPETQQIRGDIKLQEIKLKNNFIFPASYQLPDVTACLYDSERNLKVGYSVAYKTEDSSFIEDLVPTHRDMIVVQPNTETKIYLCRFTGVEYGADYKNCDQVLLLSNVGMDNYSYYDYITEEDILRSEKIKILE